MKTDIKVMVFGVFDGIHEGHRALLKEARTHGNFLIAVVTQDAIVQQLKGHAPRKDFVERKAAMEQEIVDLVVEGDATLGGWDVITTHRPDIVALGYDQEVLMKSIEEHFKDSSWRPEIVVLKPHKPDVFHSSMLGRDSIDLNP